ncbi:hypothetical protein CJ030_MR1G016590 [Morella rubra]|uniref:Putative plant transposon protein domain-containing protein n=1 Tax=Morella rubra TaxID=262757 RepID=A0A6A1WL25_9ROSI|nr:hypothetical protein CJ030_MR1G016590 [Morella rubra]
MVWEFYCSILRARDLEEPSMELIVRNVPIIFSPDELANFLGYERDLTAFPNLPMSEEGRPTKAELLPFWRIMHLILCSSIDPKKHTTELSYSRAEFLYLAVVRGLPVDIASYIYLSIRAEALKTDATISLPHGILLTQFLHAMMVPESGDEPRALPLGSINKTTLSKSIAQTRQALQVARVARPTHCMVSDISCRLTALEQKVADMDVGWKKEVATLKAVLKGVATCAELFPLTEQVVLIEEHLRHVLKLTDDDDEQQIGQKKQELVTGNPSYQISVITRLQKKLLLVPYVKEDEESEKDFYSFSYLHE